MKKAAIKFWKCLIKVLKKKDREIADIKFEL